MRSPLTALVAAGLLALVPAAPAMADHRGDGGHRVEFHFFFGEGYGHRGGVVLYPDVRHRDRPGYYDGRRYDHDARKRERVRKHRHERHRRDLRPRYREARRGFRGDRRFLGYTAREILHELRYRGFHHIEIDPDEHEFEIEARRGGREWEMEVSRRSGRVTELEIED